MNAHMFIEIFIDYFTIFVCLLLFCQGKIFSVYAHNLRYSICFYINDLQNIIQYEKFIFFPHMI